MKRQKAPLCFFVRPKSIHVLHYYVKKRDIFVFLFPFLYILLSVYDNALLSESSPSPLPPLPHARARKKGESDHKLCCCCCCCRCCRRRCRRQSRRQRRNVRKGGWYRKGHFCHIFVTLFFSFPFFSFFLWSDELSNVKNSFFLLARKKERF